MKQKIRITRFFADGGIERLEENIGFYDLIEFQNGVLMIWPGEWDSKSTPQIYHDVIEVSVARERSDV